MQNADKVPSLLIGELLIPIDRIEGVKFRNRVSSALGSHAVEADGDAKLIIPSDGCQPGDIVRLKSGGPAMTVSTVYDDHAECAWFNGTETFRGKFTIATLERIPAQDQMKRVLGCGQY